MGGSTSRNTKAPETNLRYPRVGVWEGGGMRGARGQDLRMVASICMWVTGWFRWWHQRRLSAHILLQGTRAGPKPRTRTFGKQSEEEAGRVPDPVCTRTRGASTTAAETGPPSPCALYLCPSVWRAPFRASRLRSEETVPETHQFLPFKPR